MNRYAAVAGLFWACIFGSFEAQGADAAHGDPAQAANRPRNEIRGGVLYHDFMERESDADFNIEYLSRFAAFDLFVPRTGI